MRLSAACLLFSAAVCFAQERPVTPAPDAVDEAAVAFFTKEGTERSQVMEHLSWICDVYGPRVTGSPNLRRAQEWAAKTFAGFGYRSQLETWGRFGRGWRCDHVVMAVVGDNPWPVIAYAKVWSPGLPGRIEADVVDVAAMTLAELEAADLTGKVVLIETPRELREPFDAPSKRHDAESLLRLADQQRAEAQPAADRAAAASAQNDFRIGFQRRQQMLQLVVQKQPLLIVDRAAKGDYGTVFVQGANVPSDPGLPREQRPRPQDPGVVVVPQFTIAVEHYNRICRLLQKGLPVRVAVELRVTEFADDLDERNVLADLAGGDPQLGSELAMLGAHLDSWQAGTGCTDNGCGSAVVIEAARLLAAWCKQQGTLPRRTIRAALWSGEEQGLLGSRGYVKQHLGTQAEPTAEQARVAGYFNLDNGTGRIRGVYLQGNEAVAPIFRQWLRPFHGRAASTLTLDDTGGTDHLAFDAVGVPGFQFIQDEVSYGTRTHHSNMDVWDHAIAEDLQQAAILMATFVWQTANRDEKLPRKGAR